MSSHSCRTTGFAELLAMNHMDKTGPELLRGVLQTSKTSGRSERAHPYSVTVPSFVFFR